MEKNIVKIHLQPYNVECEHTGKEILLTIKGRRGTDFSKIGVKTEYQIIVHCWEGFLHYLTAKLSCMVRERVRVLLEWRDKFIEVAKKAN